jgi:peptidoglycan/xylan/chitin deacetylase (PgdA/CDA1 family)
VSIDHQKSRATKIAVITCVFLIFHSIIIFQQQALTVSKTRIYDKEYANELRDIARIIPQGECIAAPVNVPQVSYFTDHEVMRINAGFRVPVENFGLATIEFMQKNNCSYLIIPDDAPFASQHPPALYPKAKVQTLDKLLEKIGDYKTENTIIHVYRLSSSITADNIHIVTDFKFPKLYVESPVNGTTIELSKSNVTSVINVTGTAVDADSKIKKVETYMDRSSFKPANLTPYGDSYKWSTSFNASSEGTKRIVVRAMDNADHTTYQHVYVTIKGNFILQPSFSSEIISYGNNGTAHSNCNCVVFRMDDIQDYWVKSGQLAAMNQFITRNQSLTLGIIMDSIGNDSEIVNMVKQGSDDGLFELAVHGWNHTDHAKLNEEEQRNSLYDSNRKMIALFGTASEIFTPPYHAFNDHTINAMKQVDMKILSANDSSFDQLELSDNNNNESRTLLSSLIQSKRILYIPVTIAFKDYYGGEYIRNSVQNILNNVTRSINAYGYAVIVFHPQDLMKTDSNRNPTSVLDENQINDLSLLIDLILSNNIHIGLFSEIVKGRD